MLSRHTLYLSVMIILSAGSVITAQLPAARQLPYEKPFLPIGLTSDEISRLDEIGSSHLPTVPPDLVLWMPAEYDELLGVLFQWDYGSYNNLMREMVVGVVDQGLTAWVLVDNTTHQNNIAQYLENFGVSLEHVEFLVHATNSIWIRDYGPWTVVLGPDSVLAVVDPIYNRPRPLDDGVPTWFADQQGWPAYAPNLVFPGGNLMVDGDGQAWCSDLVLTENDLTLAEIEQVFYDYMNITDLHVFDWSQSAVDYTGHIDMGMKLLADNKVLICEFPGDHPGNVILDQWAGWFEAHLNLDGDPYEVYRVINPTGTSYLRTYSNSLIVGNTVLVPTYGLAQDDDALWVYQEALPDHNIIGINSSAIIPSGGAIHCIAMQVPLGEPDIVVPCAGWVYGDVNNDAAVNVLDIVLVVNHILGTNTFLDCQLIFADYNSDGAVDVLDIVGIVNLILGATGL